MKRSLVFLTFAALSLSGCVHSVKGEKMRIEIKRAPTCRVVVKMDGSKVFEGTAKVACPKG